MLLFNSIDISRVCEVVFGLCIVHRSVSWKTIKFTIYYLQNIKQWLFNSIDISRVCEVVFGLCILHRPVSWKTIKFTIYYLQNTKQWLFNSIEDLPNFNFNWYTARYKLSFNLRYRYIYIKFDHEIKSYLCKSLETVNMI